MEGSGCSGVNQSVLVAESQCGCHVQAFHSFLYKFPQLTRESLVRGVSLPAKQWHNTGAVGGHKCSENASLSSIDTQDSIPVASESCSVITAINNTATHTNVYPPDPIILLN